MQIFEGSAYHRPEGRMAFIFSFTKTISALVEPDKVSIDNWCFKLFYRCTPMVLGVCTVLCCAREPLSTDAQSSPTA